MTWNQWIFVIFCLKNYFSDRKEKLKAHYEIWMATVNDAEGNDDLQCGNSV